MKRSKNRIAEDEIRTTLQIIEHKKPQVHDAYLMLFATMSDHFSLYQASKCNNTRTKEANLTDFEKMNYMFLGRAVCLFWLRYRLHRTGAALLPRALLPQLSAVYNMRLV